MATLSQNLLVPHILDRLVQHNTVVPQRTAVDQYVAAHPGLGQLLPAICAAVRQQFGPQEELSLEVYKDPEIDDQYLTLYIRQANYAPDIMDRIYQVARQFDDSLDKVSGYLLITTDFRRPRESHVL